MFVSEMKKECFSAPTFKPQSFLTRSCLHCLRNTGSKRGSKGESDGESDSEVESKSFYHYAARNWVSHYNKAADEGAEISKDAADIFLTGSKAFQTWFPIYWKAAKKYHATCDPNITGLMAASYLGLEVVVEILVREEPNVNAKIGNGWIALHWAFKKGTTVAVIEKLLGGGVDCAAQDDTGETALHRMAPVQHPLTNDDQRKKLGTSC